MTTWAQLLLFFLVMAAMNSLKCSGELSTEEKNKCQLEVENLMSCLPYAQTGSTSAPTDKCCTDLSGIRSRNAVCLCFLLSATLSGDQNAKSLNLDSTRMLKLPTACKLQNTSVSLCPKLLGLAPNSPGAAVFYTPTTGNATKTSNTSLPTPTGTATSPTSGAYVHRPSFDRRAIYAVFVAMIFPIAPF